MGFLTGKRALITGVASDRSIATGIAEAFKREGAELAFTYQGERLKARVEEFAHGLGSEWVRPLDVVNDADIAAVFDGLRQHWGSVDIVIHSIGFAPRELLAGGYLDSLTREGFALTHDISAYSFAALGKAARPLMAERGGSLLTLTYLGSERAMPMYNVMGPAKASLEANVRYMAADLGPQNIRVNGISAGPIKTLAAAGIAGFSHILGIYRDRAPLRRNIDAADVAEAAAFLLSDAARGITGEVLLVDAGFHVTGM